MVDAGGSAAGGPTSRAGGRHLYGALAVVAVLMTAAAVRGAAAEMQTAAASFCGTCRVSARMTLLSQGLWLPVAYGGLWWVARNIAPAEARSVWLCAAAGTTAWVAALTISFGWWPGP